MCHLTDVRKPYASKIRGLGKPQKNSLFLVARPLRGGEGKGLALLR